MSTKIWRTFYKTNFSWKDVEMVLLKMRHSLDLRTNKELANFFKIKNRALPNWKNRGIPDEHIEKFCKEKKISYEMLLKSEEQLEKSPPQIYNSDPMWKHFKEVIEENVKLKEELAEFKKPWDGKTFKRKNSGE